MVTSKRLRDLRHRAGLRQEDMAFLLGVGIATVNRWERPGNSLPSGLARQVYEVMDGLDRAGVKTSEIARRLRAEGNLATVRWLLNQHAEVAQEV